MDTKNRYHDLARWLVASEPRFDGGYPEWKALDRLGQSWALRAVWGLQVIRVLAWLELIDLGELEG